MERVNIVPTCKLKAEAVWLSHLCPVQLATAHLTQYFSVDVCVGGTHMFLKSPPAYSADSSSSVSCRENVPKPF